MYEVGQIIYTILEDKYKVIPLKISEQVITKTLDEETISYKVIMPGKSSKKISLDKVSNVWVDINDVNAHLLKNAKNAIEKMLTDASDMQAKYFIENSKLIKDTSTCTNETNIDTINTNDLDHIKVDLGNGQIGNLKIDQQELDQKKNEENFIA